MIIFIKLCHEYIEKSRYFTVFIDLHLCTAGSFPVLSQSAPGQFRAGRTGHSSVLGLEGRSLLGAPADRRTFLGGPVSASRSSRYPGPCKSDPEPVPYGHNHPVPAVHSDLALPR